jgi:hypothetical protein
MMARNWTALTEITEEKKVWQITAMWSRREGYKSGCEIENISEENYITDRYHT